MKKQQQLGYGIILLGLVLLVILSFVKASVDEQGALLCDAVRNNPALDMEKCPAHKNIASWYITAAFALSAFVFGAGAYLAFVQKPEAEQKGDFRHVDTAQLDEGERTVYGLLKNAQGLKYQTDLIRETGYSKVKITRILDKLESKDVVERKRRGMTNVIVLK